MTPQEYYQLTGPTEFAGPPEYYSPTSLASLRKCPLRWQLEHSQWGDLKRHPGAPNRKRIAGRVQHDLLEVLFRQLGRYGRPARRTPEFRAAMRDLDVSRVLHGLVSEAEAEWATHPRTGGAPLGLDPGDLRKRAFHLFRRSYEPASGSAARGTTGPSVLGAEVAIQDDELRLRGRVDLARPKELVEFKTGEPSPDHERQLELYGLVWSRQRSVNPMLTLVYPGETRSWSVDGPGLATVQGKLAAEVAEFDELLTGRAPAQPGNHCKYCAARAFCDAYWEDPQPGDLEFVVSEAPGDHVIGDGSLLVALGNSHVAVAGPIDVGDRVRLLRVVEAQGELTLPPWGEVYVRRICR